MAAREIYSSSPPPPRSFVALQLCPPVAVWSSHLSTNRMGFCFFQSKCVVIVSSSCDFPTRGGLDEFCSFQCPDRVEDLCMKHFWSVFPDGFWRSLRFVRNFPRSTHIFVCWRARKPGTRMKAQSEISKKDSSNKNLFSSV